MGKGHIRCNVDTVHRRRKPEDKRKLKEVKWQHLQHKQKQPQ